MFLHRWEVESVRFKGLQSDCSRDPQCCTLGQFARQHLIPEYSANAANMYLKSSQSVMAMSAHVTTVNTAVGTRNTTQTAVTRRERNWLPCSALGDGSRVFTHDEHAGGEERPGEEACTHREGVAAGQQIEAEQGEGHEAGERPEDDQHVGEALDEEVWDAEEEHEGGGQTGAVRSINTFVGERNRF